MHFKSSFITSLLFMSVGSYAYGSSYEVKAWNSCEFSNGPELVWYQLCNTEGVYQAPHCDSAYNQLRQQDCCASIGGSQRNFHTISCTLVAQ